MTNDDLRTHDDVFVGRPESNSALAARSAGLQLNYDGAAFQIDGKEHASGYEGLMLAAANPLNAKHMALIAAGNTALQTVNLTQAERKRTQYSVFTSARRRAPAS